MHRNVVLLMISSITKPKISSDYVFVLKTMQLEEILKNNDIKTDTVLVYWKPKVIGSILEAHYWLPNKNNPFNRLYIRAGVVLKKDIQNAREGMLNDILPAFVEWINNIEQLEKSSSINTEQYFNGCYQNNKAIVVE